MLIRHFAGFKFWKSRTPKRRSATRRFLQNTDGNILILFVFMGTVLFFFIGGAIDYSRWNAIRADMIESMDASSLALARLAQNRPNMSDSDLKAFGKKFFYENFNYEGAIYKEGSVDGGQPAEIIEFILDDKAVVEACVSGRMDTYLLRVVGTPYFNVDHCVEITKKGTGRVELALVLDVTGSMNSKINDVRKIDSLKDAVETMMDVLYDKEGDQYQSSEFVKLGVVPFNAFVNPAGWDGNGVSGWSSSWEDTGAAAVYHGARFIHVEGDGDTNGDGAPDIDMRSNITDWFANDQGNNTTNGIAKVVNPGRRVSHYDLFNTVNHGDSDAGWMGCVEARPYPLDELDTPPGTSISGTDLTEALATPADDPALGDSDEEDRTQKAFDDAPSVKLSSNELTDADNTRWVPFFQPDETDCIRRNPPCRNEYGTADSSGVDYADYDLGGVNRVLWHKHQMFDTPNYVSGISISSASNWVSDDDYADPQEYSSSHASRENFERYLEVVLGHRYVWTAGAILDTYWSSVKSLYQSFPFGYDDQEFILRMAYVGWWDDALGIYKGKYDGSASANIDDNISSTDDNMRGPNHDCPPPVMPLNDNPNTVFTYVKNELHGNGNTNIANGAIWGWRLLSPEAPFTEGIGPNDDDYDKWQKAIVIMTDGDNVVSSRDSFLKSRMTAYGYPPEERMGDGVDTASKMRNEMDNKLLRICHRMKAEKYLVYTIMFGLDSDSTEKVFRACATPDTDDSKYFFEADNETELKNAFRDIAADLVDLHVSK